MSINLSRRSVYGKRQAVTLCSSCCDTPIDIFMFYNELNYLSLLQLPPAVPRARASDGSIGAISNTAPYPPGYHAYALLYPPPAGPDPISSCTSPGTQSCDCW